MSGDISTKVSFLKAELDRQQQQFSRRRRRDKRKAFALQMATVVLSATITVMLGLRTGDSLQPVLANVALVLGAMITVLSAMEAFFNHRGLWINRTITVRKLEDLRRHMDFRLAGTPEEEIPPAEIDQLLRILDQIISEDQRTWLRIRSTEGSLSPPVPANVPAAVDRPTASP